MGIEEEGQHLANGFKKSNGGLSLNLLPEEDFDHLESRLTSVSSKATKGKVVAGSLATVLG